jgi:hypothetical protein
MDVLSRQQLDAKAAAWLEGLPAFVQAVTVKGEDFLAATDLTFDAQDWSVGHDVGGWTISFVTETSVRFKRRKPVLES